MRLVKAMLLTTAMLAAMPASAVRPTAPTATPTTLYARARAADAAGMTELAATTYAQVLAMAPGDESIAARTYRQALAAGDNALALRAARILDGQNALPPDGRLLLLAERLLASDWRAAGPLVDKIESEGVFAFAVPVLRAWIAQGSRNGDPFMPLVNMRAAGATSATYAAEQRALLLLARGQYDEAMIAVNTLIGANANRPIRLRFAAAAALAKAGRRDDALSLVQGDDPSLALARQRIGQRRSPGAVVTTPAEGVAELFARLAIDINRERVSPVGLALARISTYLSPRNASGWIVAAEMLGANEQYDTALGVLAKVPAEDPMAPAARDARIQILVRKGDTDEALREANLVAAASGATAGDWARVGEILSNAKRNAEAARAYGRAVALSETVPDDGTRWTLLLLQGSAQHGAGDWAGAKATLQKAMTLAPDQPVLLNFLGYSQLERRENLPEAQRLIERASALRPDDAAITDSLGWTYFVRGDLPRAVETLERAAAGDPGESTISEHLGDAYWQVGRRLEARYAWNAALVYAEDAARIRIRAKIDRGLTPETVSP